MLKGVVLYMGKVDFSDIKRKRDKGRASLKALDEGPYEFKEFVPEGSTIPRLQMQRILKSCQPIPQLLIRSVHSEARSWSIPFEDPYEEVARQFVLSKAPRIQEYVVKDQYCVTFLSLSIPEDLETRPRMRHLLHPFHLSFLDHGHHHYYLYLTAHLTSQELIFPRLTAARRDYYLLLPDLGVRLERVLLLLLRDSQDPLCEDQDLDTDERIMTALELVNGRVTYQKDRAAVRAEIEVLRRERLAYEQESIQTNLDLA
ncbi:hypothetical protein Tco_1272493 [Tanacetum coccineum]